MPTCRCGKCFLAKKEAKERRIALARSGLSSTLKPNPVSATSSSSTTNTSFYHRSLSRRASMESESFLVVGETLMPLTCPADVAALARTIELSRVAHGHLLNARSSRSHCLVRVFIKRGTGTDDGSPGLANPGADIPRPDPQVPVTIPKPKCTISANLTSPSTNADPGSNPGTHLNPDSVSSPHSDTACAPASSHRCSALDPMQGRRALAGSRQQFCFVDLAGSERIHKSGAVGDCVSEAIKINSSLTVLGHVIHQLARSESHVPFRGSILTMLLQPAFEGRSFTSGLRKGGF